MNWAYSIWPDLKCKNRRFWWKFWHVEEAKQNDFAQGALSNHKNSWRKTSLASECCQDQRKGYILVWTMRSHTWEQMASESWCAGSEPGRCQQENVSFEDSMDSTSQPMHCKENGPVRGRRWERARGTSLWWRQLENRTTLLMVSILHQRFTERHSWLWAARAGVALSSTWCRIISAGP